MKKHIILITVLALNFGIADVQGQLNHLLYATISNNGQLGETMAHYYFEPDSYNPADDVFSFKQSELKYNLHYELLSKNGLLFTSTFGYGYRNDKYVISNQSGIPPDGTEHQSYLSFALGTRYAWSMAKFQISTGIELPVFIISDCVKTFIQDDPNRELDFTTIISGGHAFGLNSTTSLKWFPTDRFFLSANMSFGIIAFDIGDKSATTINHQDPIITGSTYNERESTYKKVSVMQPELFLGIGFKFGK